MSYLLVWGGNDGFPLVMRKLTCWSTSLLNERNIFEDVRVTDFIHLNMFMLVLVNTQNILEYLKY